MAPKAIPIEETTAARLECATAVRATRIKLGPGLIIPIVRIARIGRMVSNVSKEICLILNDYRFVEYSE